ncbi:MAG: GNAT family N-acetyltransferase [Methanomassiliicoccus sp.]|nr:GNAT family N-acetyltransferase [Methanomassiliicoccus sp.]
MTDKPEFISGGMELIDETEGLWRQLNLHASEHSVDFAQHYAARSFDQRRRELRSIAERGRLHIDIARESGSSQELGYCASSVDEHGVGTIESLFVREQGRARGIGDLLMRRNLEWLRENGARSIVVFTVYGNDKVLPFYHRYGFKPKALMLEIKD